jgi:hypothetical protein
MMNRYLKASLILSGLTIFLFHTSPFIHAKAVRFCTENVEKITNFLAPAPTTLSAPANDDCANAIVLTVNPTCSFTAGTVDQATQSNAPVACNGSTSATAFDVWYKFTAGPSGQKITVKGSSAFDAVIVLMDTCSGTVLDCANNSSAGGTEVLTTTGLTSGTTYFIRIFHNGNALPTTTDFDICVALPFPPPANDNCANATMLTVDSVCNATSGTVAGASQSSAPDSCSGFASPTALDVWYTFVATDSISVITVQGSLSFDAVVSLRDSCSGEVIKCADHTVSGGIETIRDSNLVIGNTYYIRVYAYGTAIPSTPDFDICVALPTPPPLYDNCSGAILLSIDSSCNYISGSVDGATQSDLPDSCGGFASPNAYDVWYKFVAGGDDIDIKVKGSSSFDPVIFLKDSCGGNTIACADLTVSGGTETITTTGLGLIPGHTYYIRVYDYGNDLPETPTFDICVALPPPPPANDDCTGAIILVADTVCNATSGSILGATQSGVADSCNSISNSSAYDVWYKFVATTTNNIVTVTGSASFDAIVVVKDSCNGSVIACADNTVSGDPETAGCTGLIVGNTYYVRVYPYGSAQPNTLEFTICVSIPPPPPVNDDCANALLLTSDSACTILPGTVLGATQSGVADSCNNFQSSAAFDVWYKFIATSTNQSVSVKGSASFDAVVILKDGCTGTTLGCSDETTTGGTETIDSTSLTVGNTYYVRVYDYGSIPPETSDFTICLTDLEPLSSSVASIEKNNSVMVYPNPATNKITINLKSITAENAEYKIMNVNGQVVADGKFAGNNTQKDIDLSTFTPGIYNLQVVLSTTVINKKIIVLK